MTRNLLLAAALAVLAVNPGHAGGIGSPTDAAEWNFRVYLDGDEIGFHNFRLVEQGDQLRLMTEAEFRVRFLFVTAYHYEHVNEETWQGDCLQEISSRTDANGQRFAVQGSRHGDDFEVRANEAQFELSGCIRTFAYWNPDILDAPALLNSQTGEVLPVDVTPVATEKLVIRGELVPARRYRLTARNMELDIWYSQDDEWLALESTVKGGRKLRYELT